MVGSSSSMAAVGRSLEDGPRSTLVLALVLPDWLESLEHRPVPGRHAPPVAVTILEVFSVVVAVTFFHKVSAFEV